MEPISSLSTNSYQNLVMSSNELKAILYLTIRGETNLKIASLKDDVQNNIDQAITAAENVTEKHTIDFSV